MKALLLAVACGAALAGCEKKKNVLPGVRLDINTPVGAPDTAAQAELPAKVPPLRLPAPRDLAQWTHRMGGPEHRDVNAVFSDAPQLVWSVNIGAGQSRRARIDADPVSDGVRVYTIGADEHLVATNFDGTRAWSRDLTPYGEGEASVTGAGLAVGGGTVFATSGFGTLTAVDAATGQVRWTQALDAVPSGPPTVYGGLVYLVSRDNRAWAIDVTNGRVRWQISGQQTITGFGPGAGPAVSNTLAIFPFSSGEIIGVLRKGGVQLWSSAVSGARVGRVYAEIGDITADPVIVGNRVYTGTQAGRLAALELNSGKRIWTADTGVMGPVIDAGGSIWLVSDQARLQRRDARTGRLLWSRQLPYFRNPNPKKRQGIYVNYGPILAGNRLWVPSSDGKLYSFDPTTGASLSTIDLGAGASGAPLVVRRTMFIVTEKGDLLAFR